MAEILQPHVAHAPFAAALLQPLPEQLPQLLPAVLAEVSACQLTPIVILCFFFYILQNHLRHQTCVAQISVQLLSNQVKAA